MKKNSRIIYRCSECGHQSPRWMGRCPECGAWDTLSEEESAAAGKGKAGRSGSESGAAPVPINEVELEDDYRVLTGIGEFDRVLGGGIIDGSLVLIGGDPGIGKSTLMLQVLDGLARNGSRVLYVSGEESLRQLKMRSQRLNAVSPGMMAVSDINIDSIVSTVQEMKPAALVIDSIQTMFSPDVAAVPGSVSQVREAAMKLMVAAKQTGVPAFLIGHVTKEGAIAGPRLMEHMVDTVLYFEGDQNHVFRILRAVKNRFGSTNEIGVFEMKASGLEQVPNPSAVFLAERAENAAGSVVAACMEGSRPILVELQALISSVGLGTPRRTVLGLDYNRVSLLVAVMEKKLGLDMAGHDIFMNVAGGVKVSEPAADLGIAAAVASSFLDRPVPEKMMVLGEVGLAGEVRGISQLESRISEIRKMGFTRCIVPRSSMKTVSEAGGVELLGISRLAEMMDILF